jgi:molecular chaperone GrpE (heat shock protein)
MREHTEPKLPKWPFFAGDALLLGVGYFVYFESKLPLGPWQIGLIALCVAGGACLSIIPFLVEYRACCRLLEIQAFTTVVSQIKNLEGVAAQITDATSRWQTVQGEADKVAAAAKGISERMSAEVQAFTEFMQRMNDSEKGTLRLEVEKLRRVEKDWLQVLVRMLDHVYALHSGALRSGQPSLIEQLAHFQEACRDAARRVGLTPFIAEPASAFDAQRHQVIDGDGKPPADATVAETVATGYTFQGTLLRPALVRVDVNKGGDGPIASAAEKP